MRRRFQMHRHLLILRQSWAPLAGSFPLVVPFLWVISPMCHQRLCHQVGVAEWEIARFVLLDLPPAVRRWQARLPDVGLLLGGTEAPPWFTVEIRDPRFSYVEIRALFGSLVRDGLIVSATSSADQREKLERLRQFVIERRDRPWPPGAWIDIVRDWNEANPDEHYTLRAIQRAYSKVCKLHGEEKAPIVRGRRRRPHSAE